MAYPYYGVSQLTPETYHEALAQQHAQHAHPYAHATQQQQHAWGMMGMGVGMGMGMSGVGVGVPMVGMGMGVPVMMSDARRSLAAPINTATTTTIAPAESWTCSCGNVNFGNRLVCNMRKCGLPKVEGIRGGVITLARAGAAAGSTGVKRNYQDMSNPLVLPSSRFPPHMIPSGYQLALLPINQNQKRQRRDDNQLRNPGDWICKQCGNTNYASRTTCNMRRCGAERPANDTTTPLPTLSRPLPPCFTLADLWKCDACGNDNYPNRNVCNMKRCGKPRPAHTYPQNTTNSTTATSTSTITNADGHSDSPHITSSSAGQPVSHIESHEDDTDSRHVRERSRSVDPERVKDDMNGEQAREQTGDIQFEGEAEAQTGSGLGHGTTEQTQDGVKQEETITETPRTSTS